jgi:hypothetical protein
MSSFLSASLLVGLAVAIVSAQTYPCQQYTGQTTCDANTTCTWCKVGGTRVRDGSWVLPSLSLSLSFLVLVRHLCPLTHMHASLSTLSCCPILLLRRQALSRYKANPPLPPSLLFFLSVLLSHPLASTSPPPQGCHQASTCATPHNLFSKTLQNNA